MNLSKLSSNEKMAVYASAVVVVTGIVSLVNDWGGLIVLPLLAALGTLLVLFAPSIMPNNKLPGSKGSLMLILGGVAALFWVIAALTWLDWIFGHLGTFDTLQFLVGLIASLIMGWTDGGPSRQKVESSTSGWPGPRLFLRADGAAAC
jgi:hypothetical protein